MRKIIQDQLDKVIYADLSNFDEATCTYHIPKQKEKIRFEINKTYIIKLDQSLLKFGENPILESNWNNGKVPKNIFYKAEVTKIVGKMVYITGIEFDLNLNADLSNFWQGYLPIDKVEIIKILC